MNHAHFFPFFLLAFGIIFGAFLLLIAILKIGQD